MQSYLLNNRYVTKPWGKQSLPQPFCPRPGERIGEIWFEPPPAFDSLLVKYIFTDEALSVQVHPSNEQTMELGLGSQGKEECWLVIDADPDAKLGIGFHETLDQSQLRAAALDGSIQQLMRWYPVRAGDFFYIPANTVHAIGAGVSLIEVQQNSDITYRLYDYGRPRELHLDEGVSVARAEPYLDKWWRHTPQRGELTLVEGPFFRLDRIDGPIGHGMRVGYADTPVLVMPLSDGIKICGLRIAPGECSICTSLADVRVPEGAQALLVQPR